MCKRCLYTDKIPIISFDSEGICSYCRMLERMDKEYPNGPEGERILLNLVDKIKRAGRNKKYDCVVGVSGGCDSSYLLYKMVDYGLRPLAAHFDNTWNSKIATENIHLMTSKLNVDLFTIVVNNKEFDDILRSFFRASVVETNVATDIGLATTLYKAAEKHGIKYQIEGHSFRTEGVAPMGWGYMDAKYIQSVHNIYGTCKLKTFPNLWLKDFLKWILLLRIRKIRPLYYMDYNKENVKEFLKNEFGWQWYGGHHLENKMSQFSHTYSLPKKFGQDQRANGYGALIRSGQMSREEGLLLMSKPPEYDPELIEYLKKRLGFSDEEFEEIMNLPIKTYKDYKTYKQTFVRMKWFFWAMYKLDLVPKSFYVKYATNNLQKQQQRERNKSYALKNGSDFALGKNPEPEGILSKQ